MTGAKRRVAVSGTSGLVGGALRLLLEADGHTVVPLVRRRGKAGAFWSPETGEVDAAALEGVDAVVHLAGESIAAGRWTAARKAAIRDSRVNGTALLAGALAGLKSKPRAFVCASAVGYYGAGSAAVDERAPAGSGFLAEVCKAWEGAAAEAASAGIRVVHARIGVVLALAGGALAKMLPPFRLGLGGPVGDGRQWMSWIALPDCAAALRFLALESPLSGPVNLVAPGAVTNAEFAATLGRALGRPAFMPLPAFMVRALFGEMGAELLLAGQRVTPAALTRAGFKFQAPDLDGALRLILGR